ncbi:MAG: CARDB domain-containing protein [Candidatus Thermoplasmatota archaeon]
MKIKAFIVVMLLALPIINAQGKPDLYIVRYRYSPDKIYEGDQLRINVTVGNRGDEKAENVALALFVDNSTNKVDEVTIPLLNAREEKEKTLYWLAEKGEHTLYIFVDYTGTIDELSEDNNILTLQIEVSQPSYPQFPPPPEQAEWWDGGWHYRVPLIVSMIGERENYPFENKIVLCNINFTYLMDKIYELQAGSFSKRNFYPDSVRIVEYELKNNTWVVKNSVGREIILSDDYDAYKNANLTVIWVMEGEARPHERRFYYIYWDTVENGIKEGDFGKIYSGIKNCEFEEQISWKNITEGTIKWNMSYYTDPVEKDGCYRIYAKGIYGAGYLWAASYAKLYQDFRVPDGGLGYYILHSKIYFSSDIDAMWKITIDGQSIEMGYSTGGWKEITKNITAYLKGKNYATISFIADVPSPIFDTKEHEIIAYIDACWIETQNLEYNLFSNNSHGWSGKLKEMKKNYIIGVMGNDTINKIEVESDAELNEVVAILYSPEGKIVSYSMPISDASFEKDDSTALFSNNEWTASSKASNIANSGARAIELKLNNYIGKWEFQNRKVNSNDSCGLKQNITYEIPLSNIPSLYFWYRIDKYNSKSSLIYTLYVSGSSPKSIEIPLATLTADKGWHKYEIPREKINEWRGSGGSVNAIEIKIVAKAEEAENTVYIDDLGYSFMPSFDRKLWNIENFYRFVDNPGKWRADIIMIDGSDYRIENTVFIDVDTAPDLTITKIDCQQNVKEGEKLNFVVYAKNSGVKDINESIPINVSLLVYQGNNSYKFVKSINGLKVDEIKEINFEWIAKYGSEEYNGRWEVIARINEKGEIVEKDMSDNWWHNYLTVEPMPDLEINIDDTLFNPSNPEENSTFNISIIVHNVGYKNATAKISLYSKKIVESNFVLIQNSTVEKFIEKKKWERVVIPCKFEGGKYNIMVEVVCDGEVNLENNYVIKDIKIGRIDDFYPPVIEGIRAEPDIQGIGKHVNISARIYDNETSIDKAYVVLGENEYIMKRFGCTDIYYANLMFNEIGFYEFVITAFDTSIEQNYAESDRSEFRVVYEGIETNPPNITGITISPPGARQVVREKINISAYVDDESGIKDVFVVIDGAEYAMIKGAGKIYYYENSFNKCGRYSFFIKAIDNSANSNFANSEKYYFEIPYDYDFDDVPDEIEILVGGNPKNASQTVNVSNENVNGYLIWIESEGTYIYWNKDKNETYQTKEIDVDGDGMLDYVFDRDGDGETDSCYNKVTNSLLPYKETKEEKVKTNTVWLIPPLLLFIVVCTLFIFIKRKK